MKIQTVEDAIEAYTAQDAWQFADRQAAWAWMFEQGRKAGMNECYRLAMTASEPAKGGSFNDGKWAVADAIKMRAAVSGPLEQHVRCVRRKENHDEDGEGVARRH